MYIYKAVIGYLFLIISFTKLKMCTYLNLQKHFA